MKTSTEELRAYLPRLYATREEPDPVAVLRFVAADGGATAWYAVEFDGRDTLYGLVVRQGQSSSKMEYFSLRELEQPNGHGGSDRAEPTAYLDDRFVPQPVSRIWGTSARFPGCRTSFQPHQFHLGAKG